MIYIFNDSEVQYQLREFVRGTDYEPLKTVIFKIDSKIHRYPITGDKRGDQGGAYCIYEQEWPAGWFKNWRTGETINWAFPPQALSEHAKKYFRENNIDIQKLHEESARNAETFQKEQASRATAASYECKGYIKKLEDVPANHPYLVKKQVKAWGEMRYDPKTKCLVLPLFGFVGNNEDYLSDKFFNIQTLQYLYPDGKKMFHKDGKLAGAFYPIGVTPKILADKKDLRPVIVGEGYATMATVYECTGYPCIAAMTCHNMSALISALVNMYPDKKFIIAADNDRKTKDNPGLTAAREAVADYNLAGLIVPNFSRKESGSDWNDYSVNNGRADCMDTIQAKLRILMLPKAQQSIMEKVTEISAQALYHKKFKPITWAVDGFLPSGLSVLAGGPKVGKSIFSLHTALAVALGGIAFGKIKCEPGDVLYLSLEDTERRLQERLLASKLDIDGKMPDLSRLTLTTRVPKQHEGGLQYISWWLDDHEDARLVIIDTLQKFRKNLTAKGSVYAEDYEAIAAIKNLADVYDVPFLIIHHLKKGISDDWLNEISGSQGIAGAADTLFSLKRARGERNAILSRTGRDVEEKTFNMQLDDFGWLLLGEADDFTGGVTSTSYEDEIVKLIQEQGSLSPMTYSELAKIPYSTASSRMKKLESNGIIEKSGYRSYTLVQKNPAELTIDEDKLEDKIESKNENSEIDFKDIDILF